MGNRTDHGGAPTTGNRYATLNGASYYYDADGNVIQKYKDQVYNRQYFWNAESQLDSAIKDGWFRTDYDYNAFGKPVRIWDGDPNGRHISHYLLWDGDALLAEFDPNGQRQVDYAYLPGSLDRPFAQTLGATAPGTVRYHEVDELANVVGTSESGNLSQTNAYDAWGTVTIGGNADQHLFWKGLFWNGDLTGIYYVRNRWYDPEGGRFVNEDPAGFGGGINLYAFAGNDPINGSDPLGLDAESCTAWYLITHNPDDGYWELIGNPVSCGGGGGETADPAIPQLSGGDEGEAHGGGGGRRGSPAGPAGLGPVPGCGGRTGNPINIGQRFGEDATNYWAQMSVASASSWYAKAAANVAGLFSSLWTPDTMDRTIGALVGAYGLRVIGPFPTSEMPRWAQQSRENIRIDPPHHGKGWHLDGNPRGPIDVFACRR